MSDIDALVGREFVLSEEVVYLNHAAVAPWPLRTANAVCGFAQENAHRGSTHYPRWLSVEAALRKQLATLINAPSSDDVALLKNTSEGLSVVAYGLPWQAGDNIVISSQEFPSNRIVWESLRSQGVEVRQVDLNTDASPEDALLTACDGDTKLVAVSSVQYASGLRMDLHRLGDACRQRDILFCVDAIQSVGALVTDVQACHIDMLVADGHKWMLGPEGVAAFYVRPEIRNRLTLRQFGWHMVEHAGDYDRKDWEPAHTARRFECGSPNMVGIHGLNASISLLLEVGMDVVENRVLASAELLIEDIQERLACTLITPAAGDRHAGIVTFRPDTADVDALFGRLQDAGVMCAKRGGGIRLSPHFYTSAAALREVVDLIAGFANCSGT